MLAASPRDPCFQTADFRNNVQWTIELNLFHLIILGPPFGPCFWLVHSTSFSTSGLSYSYLCCLIVFSDPLLEFIFNSYSVRKASVILCCMYNVLKVD